MLSLASRPPWPEEDRSDCLEWASTEGVLYGGPKYSTLPLRFQDFSWHSHPCWDGLHRRKCSAAAVANSSTSATENVYHRGTSLASGWETRRPCARDADHQRFTSADIHCRARQI